MVKYLRTAIIVACCFASFPVLSAGNAGVMTAPDWAQLTPAQKDVLKPLEKNWNQFSQVRRLKWLGVANRFPAMGEKERANVRERMVEWVSLTPEQREVARERYKRLSGVAVADRQQLGEKWREYDALPVEQKQALQTPIRPEKGIKVPPPRPAQQLSSPALRSVVAPPPTASGPVALKQIPKPLGLAPVVKVRPAQSAPSVNP